MFDEKSIKVKAQQIISILNTKFFPIEFEYVYNKKEKEHFIFHNRPELEFDETFINISMELLEKYFFNNDFDNINIGYGRIMNKNLFNYSIAWDDFPTMKKIKQIYKVSTPVIYEDYGRKKYISNKQTVNKMNLSDVVNLDLDFSKAA